MKGGYNFLLDKSKSKSKTKRKGKKGGRKNKSMKRGGKMTLSNYYKYNSNAGCRVGGKRKIKGGGLFGNISGAFDTDALNTTGSLNNFGTLRQLGNFNNSLHPT